jgi:hypothetical protein
VSIPGTAQPLLSNSPWNDSGGKSAAQHFKLAINVDGGGGGGGQQWARPAAGGGAIKGRRRASYMDVKRSGR